MNPATCLSIAGFDGSGGAGIQADLKTFAALGCYGLTVLTALPVQNTQGVKHCYPLPLSCIREQLETCFEDLRPNSIKIGMLFSTEIIELVSDFLKQEAPEIPIIVDPVMVAKSGDLLLQKEATAALKTRLIPMATLITPNIPEACALVSQASDNLEKLAQRLLDLGPRAVLLKGGHSQNPASNDLFLAASQQPYWLTSPRVFSRNTHGTGCTLSAAIAAFVAKKFPLQSACQEAKKYLFDALVGAKDWNLGKGHGPLHHFHALWPPA